MQLILKLFGRLYRRWFFFVVNENIPWIGHTTYLLNIRRADASQKSRNITVIILICRYIFRVTVLSIGQRTKGLTTVAHFVLLCRRGLLSCSSDPCGVQGAIYIVRNYLYRSREKRIVETCVSNNQLYGPFARYKIRFKMNAALLPLQSSSLNQL